MDGHGCDRNVQHNLGVRRPLYPGVSFPIFFPVCIFCADTHAQDTKGYGLDTPPFDKGVFTHHAISSSINLFHPASPSAIHVPFAPSLYPYLLGERSVLMFTSLYVYWPPTECALGR